MRATKGKRPAPPQRASAPPRVGDAGREGRTAAPPPEGKAARRGGGGVRVRDTTVPKGSKRRAGPGGGGTGGGNAEWEGRRRGPRGVPHSPAEGQVPRHVPVPCLRCAYAGGRAASPPLPTPNSHTHQGKGRGQRGEGEETWGKTVVGSGPPPRGRRGRVGRQRNESAGRTTRPCPKGARAVQAPTGGPPGVQPQEG